MKTSHMFLEDVLRAEERGKYMLASGLEELSRAILDGSSSREAMVLLSLARKALRSAAAGRRAIARRQAKAASAPE